METIKERASRYSGATENEKAYFEMGANAVLVEIENIIAVGCDDVSFDIILRGKIKELKGE